MQSHSSFQRILRSPVCKSFPCAAFLALVISTSVVVGQEAAKNQPPPDRSAAKEDDLAQLRKSVSQLSAEVARLKAEVAKLEKYRQIDYLRDLLLKEEQRVEAAQKD